MTKDRLEFLRVRYKNRDLKKELERLAFHGRCGYISKTEMELISWVAYESMLTIRNLRRLIERMRQDPGDGKII